MVNIGERSSCKIAYLCYDFAEAAIALCFMEKNQQSRRRYVPEEGGTGRCAEATDRYLEAMALANQQRKLVLQEVLSKPHAETLPLAEQEFYELCIEESNDVWRPGLIVKQTHAQWSEIDRQFIYEDPQWERWLTLQKAEEQCEEWRKALASKGFTQSDLDF
jgi:hypothetical protein